MAENTKDVLLNIQVAYKDSINNIIKLQKQLDELKIEQLKVNGAVKAGQKTREEADKELAAIAAQTRLVNNAMREHKKEIDANLQAEEAQNGSLKEMRAQLKLLIQSYDALSATDRTGGIGEAKLKEIKDLQKALSDAEEATGRFQRKVGSYEQAIKNALDGTVPLKTALKELKKDIENLTFQYRESNNAIKNQQMLVNQLATEKGKESQEYRDAVAELERMKKAYDDMGNELNNMKLAAGNMKDAVNDANASVTNFGKDNANLKAANEGLAVLGQGYTAINATMVALGMESEDLAKVFLKMQMIQQGLNAVNQIMNSLEEQSVLRQQAKLLWTKLTTKAKQEETAATVGLATATEAVAAAEVTATTASGGLVGALKAVGLAIKSIPIIGWIAAAVAALGGLIALIYKANKADKEHTMSLRDKVKAQKEFNKATSEAVKSVEEEKVKLETNVRLIKQTKQGTDEWKRLVEETATQLGVSAGWLEAHTELIDDIKDAWIGVKVALAEADVYTKRIAANNAKSLTLENDLQELMRKTDYKDRAKVIANEYKVSMAVANSFVKAENQLTRAGKNKTSQQLVDYYNALNAIDEEINKQTEKFRKGIDRAYDDQVNNQKNLNNLTKDGLEQTQKTINSIVTNTNTDVEDMVEKLKEQLEDLVYEGMADGIEKEIKQIQKASDRWVESMKKARDKDLKNKDLYDAIILQKEKNTQAKIDEITNKRYSELSQNVKTFIDEYNQMWFSENPISMGVNDIQNSMITFRDFIVKYKSTIEETYKAAEKLGKTFEKPLNINQTGENFLQKNMEDDIWKRYAQQINSIFIEESKRGLKEIPDTFSVYIDYMIRDMERKVTEMSGLLEDSISKDNKELSDEYYTQYQNFYTQLEDFRRIRREMNEATDVEKMEMSVLDNDELKRNEIELIKVRNQIEALNQVKEKGGEIENQIRDLEEKRENRSRRLLEIEYELLNVTDEKHKAKLLAEVDDLKSVENYDLLINNLKQQLVLLGYTSREEIEKMLNSLLNTEKQFANNSKKIFNNMADNMLQAFSQVTTSLGDLFSAIGEDNAKMANFLQGIAYVQIGVNMAAGIAGAVASGSGQPFPYNLAAIAAGVAAVIAAMAQAIQTYKQYHTNISSPSFAEGGLIGGRYARTRREGVADDVKINASRGEYIITAERTRELGVDFLDRLNYGKLVGKKHKLNYADGGYVDAKIMNKAINNEQTKMALVEALREMPNPIVSVTDIRNVSRKVEVKEKISNK